MVACTYGVRIPISRVITGIDCWVGLVAVYLRAVLVGSVVDQDQDQENPFSDKVR